MKLSSDRFFTLLITLLSLTACPAFNTGGGGGPHCRQYNYNKVTKQWTDALGNVVSCSIADNNKIFPYFPDGGCNYWIEFFKGDPTVKFIEVPIRVGDSSSSLLQTYCIKQRYVEVDHSGQVLLIDQGAYCLKEYEDQEKEYMFSTCDGVYRKRKDSTTTEEEAETQPAT